MSIRDFIFNHYELGKDYLCKHASVYDEALVELDALKAERDSWKDNAYKARDRADRVTVERDMYRKALEGIKQTWLSNKDCAIMFRIARTATEVKN